MSEFLGDSSSELDVLVGQDPSQHLFLPIMVHFDLHAFLFWSVTCLVLGKPLGNVRR